MYRNYPENLGAWARFGEAPWPQPRTATGLEGSNTIPYDTVKTLVSRTVVDYLVESEAQCFTI